MPRSLPLPRLVSTTNRLLASQALSEVTHQDHSMSITLLLLVRARYIWVLFFTNLPFMVNHTFNTTPMERLQQHPLLFTMNCTEHTFCLCRLHLARPSHPGHSIILLRSETPSGMCAKLHIVAASNNRDHTPRSLSSSPLASTINCLLVSQALLEATHQDHSIIACSCYIYIGFVICAQPIHGESHIQCNGDVATPSISAH